MTKEKKVKIVSNLKPSKFKTAEALWVKAIGKINDEDTRKQFKTLDPKLLSLVQKFFFVGAKITLDSLADLMDKGIETHQISSQNLEKFEEEFMVDFDKQLYEIISSTATSPLIEISYE